MGSIEIEREFLPTLAAAGLNSFTSLGTEMLGRLVTEDGNGREVRRLSLLHDGHEKTFYLKRIGLESPLASLRMLLYGKRPSSGAVRERMMLSALTRAGFPTMKVAAWGEKRRCGFPVKSFILVEGVEGREVAELYRQAEGCERDGIAKAMGQFIGRLHAAGFFQAVRIKDLLDNGRDADRQFVMIDRESSKPWPAPFFQYYCFRSLARIYRRTIRDGFTIGHSEVRAFAAGYVQAIGSKTNMSRRRLVRQVVKKLGRLRKANPSAGTIAAAG